MRRTTRFLAATLVPLFLMADARAQDTEADNMKISLMAGGKRFAATLYDTEAARAFISMLPMTLDMRDLNGNEKYHELPQSLPGKAAYSGTIQAGDLMLWSSNTLVLFYDAFSTRYRYVRLGRVDDAANLAPALGAGSVKITFTLDSHSQPAARQVSASSLSPPREADQRDQQ